MNNQPLDLNENIIISNCVVRLRTTYWNDYGGIYSKKSITLLKKLSQGNDFIIEDATMEGAESIFPRIINLDKCPDGIYNFIIANPHHDFETGTLDDYDFQLVPMKKEQKNDK